MAEWPLSMTGKPVWMHGPGTSTAIKLASCPHCGWIHSGVCARIASIEYYPNGRIKRVTYVQPAMKGKQWQG